MGLSVETIRLLSSKLGRRAASAVAADIASGGGGGGLVVGAWESVDFSDVPTFPASDPYVLPALDVPSEVEVIYVPNPSESGAFTIESANDPGVVTYASSITSWDLVTYSYPFRTIVPPGVPIQIRALFGGSGWVVQNINRRTLG